jgi:hypothetical protein
MDNKLILQDLLKHACNRWLQGIDFRPYSETFGVADRDFWAWKTKDFANGTCQAGISAFLNSKDLISYSDQGVKDVLSAVIRGASRIQKTNGSFEEAYPYESSYAVTGLVLFNFLYSILKFPRYFDPETKIIFDQVVLRAYNFLARAEESHGLISNHVCSTVLSLQLFELYKKNSRILNEKTLSFLKLQSLDGWFPEYGHPDPGYQTLLNHYLSAFLEINPDPQIRNSLDRSLEFVNYFTYPDGSFGGEVGSRGTKIVYPSGIYNSNWLTRNIQRLDCVTPITVDSGNFVPVLNSWAQALINPYKIVSDRIEVKRFEEADIFYKSTNKCCLIVNLRNGSYIRKVLKKENWHDSSGVDFIVDDKHSQLGTSRIIQISEDIIELELFGKKNSQMQNSMFKAIILRIVGGAIYYLPIFQLLWKKLLALVVMGSRGISSPLGVKLVFDLSKEEIPVTVISEKNYIKITSGFCKHMASANTLVRNLNDSKI